MSDVPAGASAAGGAANGTASGVAKDLRGRVAEYLRAHHTMTVATMGSLPVAGAGTSPGDAADFGSAVPHAASVFYAVDDHLRLIFLSKSVSTHGLHIGRKVTGSAKVAAMAAYLRRFPFVDDLLEQPRLAAAVRKVSVYRVEPHRVAFTDNTTGVFGREILDLKG